MTVEATKQADPSVISGGLASLRGALSGTLLVEGDPDYDKARGVWNAMIDRHPLAIAVCKDADDVVSAVRFARDHNLPVSIKAGGHNVAGHAVCDDGLMIDLSQMRSVRVGPAEQRAHVAGGARWGDVDRETLKWGLATPGGLISDTGVAGLTLSGGVGWLRSRYGLCIDNLVSMQVVTANGDLVTASEESNPDLFWALRGGGGNFGVVVSFEFALHPMNPKVMFCAPIYPIEAGPGPIRAWRDFLAGKNDRIGSLVEFSTVAESEDFPKEYWGRRCYTIAAVYAGDPAEGEKITMPLRELGDLVTDFSGQMDYRDVQQLFDALMPAGDFRCYWKCHLLGELSDEMVDAAIANAIEAPSNNTLSSLWNFGGATAKVPADATAFGDRSFGWMYSIDSVWPDAADDESNIAFTRKAWDDTRKHSQRGRLYLNFAGHGEDNESLVRDAFGRNYARLAAIKAKYDPGNMFRFNQNIVPAGVH